MHYVVLCTLVLVSSVVAADGVVVAQSDGALYIGSLIKQKRAEICTARLPGFKEKFDPAYQKWRGENERALHDGETKLRATVPANGNTFDQEMAVIVNTAVKSLQASSPSRIKDECAVVLLEVGVSAADVGSTGHR